jgi:hypothetical protein
MMGSLLANEWRPPRIVGEVPPDYTGPVFYRSLRLKSGGGRKSFDQCVTYDNKKIDGQNARQRLASYIALNDMRLDHPDMFEASGALKGEWRAMRTAKRKTNFPKERSKIESFHTCSQWVHDAIEALEPGVHALLPVRLAGGGQEDEVVYQLIYGNGGRGFVALSPRSNPKQDWVGGGRHLMQTTEFAFLAADRVRGKHIFWCEVGYVWSKALIDQIGDVFSEEVGLVPIGVLA